MTKTIGIFLAMATTGKEDSNADPEDLHSFISQQLHELMAAHRLESDLDLAFHLQLQEALSASLSLHSSQPPPPPPPPRPSQNDSVISLTSQELSKLQQESLDHKHCLLETQKLKEDLKRQVHDEKFARQLAGIPEGQWAKWGDCFERPLGEGCSKGLQWEETDSEDNDVDVSDDGECEFRIYFKGLIGEEKVKNVKSNLAGIGVAICDFRDNLIYEIKKPLVGVGLSKQAAELKALIEGLSAALSLGLNRVEVFCDYYPIYQYVIRRWPPKQRKISMLVDQVLLLQSKFAYCSPTHVARNDIKYAFKLAREAIDSQVTRPVDQNHGKTVKETCVICLEDTDHGCMFSVDGCMHRYCFSCMKQHVEVKLLHGMVPKCPHENCKSELNVDSCKKFLTPKMIETFKQHLKEASIPVGDKVYCPYPRCSALMSRSEVSEYTKDVLVGAERSGASKCLKCHSLFCINCKVPWHSNMTCLDYKRKNPNPPAEDLKLKSLATMNLWRQCVKCNHMIELSEGCHHMTCRCGYEFCYNCGAAWRDKKATCSCPLWEEDRIWHENRDSDEEEEEEEEEDDWFEEEEEDDWLHF
ncbi:Ribonuclease H domain - like 10 [Theobroma cacao]|nr:Ribonuclease H domain - like 10 [Theobroma cacao]WRX33617.1 Ribonuclease H domain - like 10 [Theobroma cacao]